MTPGGVLLVNGIATFSITFFSLGDQSITATYIGDSNFLPSTGNDSAAPQVVNQAGSVTVLNSSVNPSVFGQVVTFTASVGAASPGQGMPTGSVDFKQGSADLTPGGVSLSAGVATFQMSTLSVGSHTITAVYSGDTNFIGSQGNDSSAPQVVTRDATTTALNANLNPSVFGRTVTLSAVVSVAAPGAGNPTGTVTFFDGSKTLGTASLGSSLQATFSTNALAGGSHTLKAVYSGNGNFVQSTSPNYSETVNRAASLTALSSSVNPSVFGQVEIFTASVAAASSAPGIPTGSVDFKQGSTDLTPGGVTLSAGVARFKTSALSVGSHTITAVYGGDTNFVGSQANDSSAPQVVTQDATTTAIKANANPSVFGRTVTLTAVVGAAAPGSGSPTGTATFLDGTKTLGTASLGSSLQATFSTNTLAVGSHTIQAVYSGDGNFVKSTSQNYSETVNRANAAVTITSSTHLSVYGQLISLTATISPVAPGAGTPTGTLTFMQGSSLLSTNLVVQGGQATFTIQTLGVGTHTITAAYSGDTNFVPSSGSDSSAPQVVHQDGTQTVVVTGGNVAVYGQAITLTASVRHVSRLRSAQRIRDVHGSGQLPRDCPAQRRSGDG